MDVLFIMVGIVLCAFFISKANIKITITHNYPQNNPQPVDNLPTQGEVDKDAEQETIPTYDDVLAEVHKILGGDANAD